MYDIYEKPDSPPHEESPYTVLLIYLFYDLTVLFFLLAVLFKQLLMGF